MNLKKKIVTRGIAMAVIALAVAMMPVKTAEARSATKAEQLAFFSNFYDVTKEIAGEYGIPAELAMAQFAWESTYGTSEFARAYHNLSGKDCYMDGGHVVCHEGGRYDSYEECIRDYCALIADKYGFRGYGNSKAIVASMGQKYSGGSQNYVKNINSMIDKMRTMEADYLASEEVQERLAKERKAELMAELAEEEIFVVEAKAKADPKTAGAVAATMPPTELTEMTVATAAQMLIDGEMGTAEEQRYALGSNYEKVQEYRIYISLPGQS